MGGKQVTAQPYFYAQYSVFLMLVWGGIFLYRSAFRREMLLMSPILGAAGPVFEYFHIQDWWRPITLTGTPIGLEDVLTGFALGGIATAAYKSVQGENQAQGISSSHLRLFTLIILTFVVFLGLYFIGDVGSAYAVFISLLLGSCTMILFRPDLLRWAFACAFLMMIFGVLVYWLFLLIYPGLFRRFWMLPQVWYARMFLGIPVAEYIWFFLVGMFVGPLHDFWRKKGYQAAGGSRF